MCNIHEWDLMGTLCIFIHSFIYIIVLLYYIYNIYYNWLIIYHMLLSHLVAQMRIQAG